MMQNLTYGEALKLFADNLDKCYFKNSGYITEFDGFYLLYFHYSSELWVVEQGCEYSSVRKKFEMNIFFTYDNERNGYIYCGSDSKIKSISVPYDKDGWFNFALMHDCTYEDYKNFLKIVKHTS